MINVVLTKQDEKLLENVVHPMKGGNPLSVRDIESLPFENPSPKSRFPLIKCLCNRCGVDHLLKDFPYNIVDTPPKKPLTKLKKPHQDIAWHKLSMYIEITIVSNANMILVYARIDPKISYNILSYEDWEALYEPQLEKLDDDFTKSTLFRK